MKTNISSLGEQNYSDVEAGKRTWKKVGGCVTERSSIRTLEWNDRRPDEKRVTKTMFDDELDDDGILARSIIRIKPVDEPD